MLVNTYRQLLKELQKLSEDQLDSNITVYNPIDGEYIPGEFCLDNDSDVLDKNHPIIVAQ